MNVTIEYFCDESGTFRTPDTHVICPLIVENNRLSVQQTINCWQRACPDLSWEKFHGLVDLKKHETAVVSLLLNPLLARRGVRTACVCHQNQLDYQFDFYLGMLVDLIEWDARKALNAGLSAVSAGRVDENIHHHFRINLAARSQLNLLKIQMELQQRLQTWLTPRLAESGLKPVQIQFECRAYLQPIAGFSDRERQCCRTWKMPSCIP
jgi:hypothetical protein